MNHAIPYVPKTTVSICPTPTMSETELPPAPFPLESLPPPLRDLSTEAARVLSLPVAMPAVCTLAVTSAALGSRLRVRSFNGKITPGNLMVLVAADTGTGKSEAFRECIAPFAECHQVEKERWREEVLPEAKAEARILAREIKQRENDVKKTNANRHAIKNDIASMEARLATAQSQAQPPYFYASDFTTAQLINLLCQMGGQLFAASPDAKNFVDMILGRYNEGGTDEEVYLKAFSLEPIDRHRITDGSHETPEACITGLWLTQPDKLNRLLAQRSLAEGGLLPRLLMMQFSCPPLRVNLHEQGIATTARQAYRDLIVELFNTYRIAATPLIIDAEPTAQQALVDYHNSIADRREGELHDVTGFAARWGEYAWRLALVIHAAQHGEMAGLHPLSSEAAQAGIALAEWFALQQLNILSHGREQAQTERYAQVLALLRRVPEITARDVYRASITPRNNPEAATALLEAMVQAGHLRFEDRVNNGNKRPFRVYVAKK